MNKVKEYENAYENSPTLKAEGLDEKFRLISEHGGSVLAVMKYEDERYGYQFATWDYTNDRQGVAHGHYYPTWSFGANAFRIAKEDFALRSGLVDRSRYFSDEQLETIHGALNAALETVDTGAKERALLDIAEQIEEALELEPGNEFQLPERGGISMI